MICAIVLAAGRSRRMGTQKLLLPLRDRPVIAHVVDEILDSPVDSVFVVVGADGERIREALAGRTIHLVCNSDPTGDMLSSIRCGLRALPEACDTIVVALGDQPGLQAGLLARLLSAQRDSGRGIVVPTHRGKGGHPLVMSARFRNQVLEQFDRIGLRGLLDAHREEVIEVETGSEAVLEDLDEPADYERLKARFTTEKPER
jgi:molybdenum cofactor cytidylyltransferase